MCVKSSVVQPKGIRPTRSNSWRQRVYLPTHSDWPAPFPIEVTSKSSLRALDNQ